MADLWSDLLRCLQLRPVGDDGSLAVFEGSNQQLEYHRVFGGQILGQFVTAARATCPDKTVKSLHTLFPKEGRADEPLRIEAARRHEGRTFATLAITATQSSGVVAAASVSMHAAEDGPDRQDIGAEVPPLLGAEHRADIGLIPWEIRTLGGLDDEAAGPPDYEMWMRTPEVDPELGPALVAYATDLTLIGTALRPLEGLSQRGAQTAYTSAVTSHTVWFHRPLRTDNWLLLRQHSPLLAHGRAFGRGDVLTEDGTLVASYAQESLVRLRK